MRIGRHMLDQEESKLVLHGRNIPRGIISSHQGSSKCPNHLHVPGNLTSFENCPSLFMLCTYKYVEKVIHGSIIKYNFELLKESKGHSISFCFKSKPHAENFLL